MSKNKTAVALSTSDEARAHLHRAQEKVSQVMHRPITPALIYRNLNDIAEILNEVEEWMATAASALGNELGQK